MIFSMATMKGRIGNVLANWGTSAQLCLETRHPGLASRHCPILNLYSALS